MVVLQKPREIAAQVLRRHQSQSDYVENLLAQAQAGAQLSGPDRGLLQELVYGVVRWQATLDWLIDRKTNGRPQKPVLQILLRLGLYQIFWLDRVPEHAAVNETVELARTLGFGPQSGFVNAILRGYLREQDATKQALAELKTKRVDLGYSHPEWLCQKWWGRYGPAKLATLLDWNNTAPRTFARVNTLKTNATKLIERWRDEGVEYDFGRWPWIDEGAMFVLKSHPALDSLGSFRDGGFYVQDPSTLLAVAELKPQPGDTVLDFCSAPGGKTTYMAQLMNNQGRIVANDNAPERLKLVRENCTRLGVTCAGTIDQAGFEIRNAKFDRVLLDAPCSNTGVMRRRVDLRWRIRPEEIERLRATQLDLLRRAAATLKPGGTLVYSTCSLEPEENSGVVKEFLTANPGYQLEAERELLPFADRVDGAYVARLRKPAD